jgi:hypothetical protein
MSCRPLEEDIMSRLPTRVIVTDNDGTEVDRGRWLAASMRGITITSDTDPTGWVKDYRYPTYRSEFETADSSRGAAGPSPPQLPRPADPAGVLHPSEPRRPREPPAMQLNPELAYALGGAFTPDQVAILTRADLTRPADDRQWALELAQLPESDRLAELGFPHPPQEGDDHDACPYCAGI